MAWTDWAIGAGIGMIIGAILIWIYVLMSKWNEKRKKSNQIPQEILDDLATVERSVLEYGKEPYTALWELSKSKRRTATGFNQENQRIRSAGIPQQFGGQENIPSITNSVTTENQSITGGSKRSNRKSLFRRR